jgi:hypothetical protein
MPDRLKAVGLVNRGVVRITGEDARGFLDNLLTNTMAHVAPGRAVHTALLTPQGKLVAEFFVTEATEEDGGGFYCDVPLLAAAELARRLGFYKLRAKVAVEELSDELGVVAVYGGAADPAELGIAFADPRLPALGLRVIAHRSQTEEVIDALTANAVEGSDYHAHRASLGIGEAGLDFTLGETFPHEINMDQLGGIDFRKGCYIGQEVVSRMQHRGAARTRLVQLSYPDGFAAPEGCPVMAGDKPLGTTGTASGDIGLAMLRLDRAADAIASDIPIMTGGHAATPVKPAWWRADWPLP